MTLKHSILSSVALAAVILAFPISSFAQTLTVTSVSGTVKDANGHVDPNVNISVTCNGHTETTTTQNDGTYQVGFSSEDCPIGDTASVSGNKGGQSGGGSGQVQAGGSQGDLTINFAVVDFSVPEFSTLLGVLGGGFALGTYLTLRKKYAGAHA